MGLKLTKEQASAVKARPTVLVSAAAGSGKTAVLVERVIRLIADTKNPIDIDKLLLVTFTNAAAAEMRTRIEKRLYEEGLKQPNNRHIIRQQILIESAKIQTIDSFCIDLVRKNFNFLGVSPDFKIIDPNSAKTILEETALEIIGEQLESGDTDFVLLADSLGGEHGVSTISDVLLSLYDNVRTMPFGEKWLEKSAEMYEANVEDTNWFKDSFSNAETVLKNCRGLIDNAIFEMSNDDIVFKACLDIFSQAGDEISLALKNASEQKWDQMVAFCKSFKIAAFGNKITKSENATLKTMLSEIRTNIIKTIEQLSKSFYDSLDSIKQVHIAGKSAISKLVEITIELIRRTALKMNEMNVLTFEAVENLTVSLLCEYNDGEIIRSELSRKICNDFQEVLVDEYQDTNTLQDRLLFAVSDDGKKLFMVGDVKQSIYGFRFANPENFLNYKNNMPAYDGDSNPSGKIVLDSNFRSRAEICDFVNFVFKLLFNKDISGMNYEIEDELKPRADFPESNDSAVELNMIECDGDDVKTEKEAIVIAEYILKNIGKEIVIDTKNNKMRSAKFSDFAILVRSLSEKSNVFVDVFSRYGIPVSVENSEFIKTAEIQLILSILKAIENPTNDVALLAMASSPIFGIDFDKIAAVRAKNKSGNLYSCFVAAADEGDEVLEGFLNQLKLFQRLSITMPLSEFIDEIYFRTSLIEIMSVAGESGRRRENLLQFKEIVFKFEQTSGFGLSGFIRHLERLAKNNSVKIPVHSEGCVRIMSIHASKGLQFPICIISSCSSQFNKKDLIKRLLVSEKYGLGLKIKSNKSDTTTIARQMIEVATRQKLIAEELRLLYVAMTRAVDKLVMFACDKNINKKLTNCAAKFDSGVFRNSRLDGFTVMNAGAYSDWIFSVAMLHKNGKALCDLIGIEHFPLDKTRSEITIGFCEPMGIESTESGPEVKKIEVEKALVDRLRTVADYEYKWSGLLNISAKTSVTEILERNSADFEPFTRKPECISEKGLSAAERGTATHRFLQFADYSAARKDINAELKRLVDFEFITQYEADAINIETAKKYFDCELCERIMQSSFVRKEQKFIYEIPALDGEPEDDSVLVQGCVDLIFEEADQLVIVDFKTTRFDSEEQFVEKYYKQLEIYGEAISKMYAKPVGKKYIYSLYLNKAICV